MPKLSSNVRLGLTLLATVLAGLTDALPESVRPYVVVALVVLAAVGIVPAHVEAK